MEIDEFQQFGEDVEKFQALQEQRETEFNRLYPEEKNTADESLTGANLTSFVDSPKQLSKEQPTDDDTGLPPVVVNAIHRDLQALSDSIDQDLDKLLNEGNENDGDELNIEDMISSSESNIALEKLEEAQIIPQSKSTPKLAPKVVHEQKESTLVSNQTSAPVESMVRRLSGQFEAAVTTSSPAGGKAMKKGEAQEQVPLSPLSADAKKQQWRMSPLELATKPGSPVAARRTLDLGPPLSHKRASFKKHDPEALELFMNSANIERLTKLYEQKLDEHKLLAIKRANALLEEPKLSDYRVPEAFREILSQERNRYIWCIKDTWYSWLEPAEELPLELSSEECYILLQIQDTGPLKYHIYLWMGNKAKDSGMKSAYSWCGKLVQSLPGRPVVYRETEGHESNIFQSVFKGDIQLTTPSVPYFNDTLEKPQLFRYKDAVFTEMRSCALHLEEEGTDITLLVTSTKLFIWLMPQIWNSEPSAIWEAANVYLTKNGQPLWAPVVMLTQYGETKEFFAHLCCWQHADMQMSAQVEQLSLPKKKRHTLRYPAIGKIKFWLLKGSTQSQLPLDKLGQFKSSDAYLMEFKHQRWQTVFLWIGSHISFELHDNSVLVTAVEWCKKMMTKPELLVIPQGLETKEFLNLFKGKCLIRDPKPGSDVHLYKVVGNDVLRTKTIEVTPSAVSLNSTHAFVLCKEDTHYAWSGQFSTQAERRGALIISSQVGPPDSLPVLLAEGLETPEFWSLLGGKSDYSHHTSNNEIPEYYSNSIYLCKGNHFIEMYRFSKDDVSSSDVILIWTSKEIYLWTGSKANVESSVHTVMEYIEQYHAKTLNEFVIHLVHEGGEPQHFWDLFSPPRSASLTDVVNKADEPEDEELNSLLISINSMVINLNTSSVLNINELGLDKPVSPLQEQFKSMKDSPLSQSCQADLQFVGLDSAKSPGQEQKPVEPVEQAPPEPTKTVKREKWSLKVDPTSYQWLTVPAVLYNDMAKKDGTLKKKAKGYLTSVTVEDWKGASINLVVDSGISALALIFLAASELKIDTNKDLTLFEANDDIGIERIIEDHELVKNIMSLWPKKGNSRLVLKGTTDKHQLWTSSMLEEEIRGFAENDVITKETFTMSVLKKGKWYEEVYTYMHDGIYGTSPGKQSPTHKQRLVAKFSTHNVYVASKKSKKRPLSGPTSFRLVIKPNDSFKDKDCIIVCAKDPVGWMKFIQLFRLLKHGAQLKGNYLAILERLKT
ncbi:uncharacterized protein [Dysidea avara]|uniref:uncharacterized protein n=1 Tax=Dysidea avara TaxID=196820 RepID=UPI0033201091